MKSYLLPAFVLIAGCDACSESPEEAPAAAEVASEEAPTTDEPDGDASEADEDKEDPAEKAAPE